MHLVCPYMIIKKLHLVGTCIIIKKLPLIGTYMIIKKLHLVGTNTIIKNCISLVLIWLLSSDFTTDIQVQYTWHNFRLLTLQKDHNEENMLDIRLHSLPHVTSKSLRITQQIKRRKHTLS